MEDMAPPAVKIQVSGESEADRAVAYQNLIDVLAAILIKYADDIDD